MVKYSFVFSIVLIIRLIPYVLTPISSSVVPGWHTTIYPPWFSFSIIQLVWLGVASVIYNYLERNGKVVSHKIFMIHIFLSPSKDKIPNTRPLFSILDCANHFYFRCTDGKKIEVDQQTSVKYYT